MSFMLIYKSSFVLQIWGMILSVSTGCTILPLSSTGTCILWNLRLVLLEYCSWLSIRISSHDILLYRAFISSYCSLNVHPCSVVLCSSFDILSLCSASLFVWTLMFPSWSAIVCCCLLLVSIRDLIWLSTHDWMLVSITEVIVSVILSVRTGTISFKTSGLVRASSTLSVTFFLSEGFWRQVFVQYLGDHQWSSVYKFV